MSNLIQVVNGKNVASSLSVAENFGRRHIDVVKTIDNLVSELEGVRKNSHTPYFEKTEYQNEQNGQFYAMYYMDRDAWALLVMGFNNSKKALEWKLKYIQAFNEMEQKINTSATALSDGRADIAKLILKASTPQLVAIKELYPEYFSRSAPIGSLEEKADKNTSYMKWKEELHITAEWIGEFPTSKIYNSYQRYCIENFLFNTLGKKQFYATLEWDFNLTRKQRNDGFRYFLSA